MNNEKIEPLLSFAMSLPLEQREKSKLLMAGYDQKEQLWEFIALTQGRRTVAEWETMFPEGIFYPLSFGYLVGKLTKEALEDFAKDPQVIYIEQPKEFYFELQSGKNSSCMGGSSRFEFQGTTLTGEGVLIGILDSGIDLAHPDFRREDGSSRVAWLWNQQEENQKNSGIYTNSEINELLENGATLPLDWSGHGTHVAGIAAGNGRASQGKITGVAPEATLIVVALKTSEARGFPKTTELMRGVEFCYQKAEEMKMPLVINLSFGNSYGSHSGSSLLETYLDLCAQRLASVMVVGTGNQGMGRGHFQGSLSQRTKLEVAIGNYESSFSLQFWKTFREEMNIRVKAPDKRICGEVTLTKNSKQGLVEQGNYKGTNLYFYLGNPSPYQVFQELYLQWIVQEEAQWLLEGIWTIEVEGASGDFEAWIPTESLISEESGFISPDPYRTLTIPSTMKRGISVGAYDSRTDQLAMFSGRGYTWQYQQVKPELVAPGVEIVAPVPGGGYGTKTGTSMATPFVSGSAALMMEWGIVRGNDPYFYGEKIKAFFIAGAKALPAYQQLPNPETGWGALCLEQSIPKK